MTLLIKIGGYGFKIGFNVFYTIMKGVPIIAFFERAIYQTFD